MKNAGYRRPKVNECVACYLAYYERELTCAKMEGLKFAAADINRWRERVRLIPSYEWGSHEQIEAAAQSAEEAAASLALLRLARIARGAGGNREQSAP